MEFKPIRSMKEPPKDHSHIQLTYITHFYCNQDGSFDCVRSLLDDYAAYPDEILDRMHFVIVDDGSPVMYEIPDVNLNLTWLRITEDIPWNNPGARNLGVTYAKSDKIILTDLDHKFPPETLLHILKRRECGKSMYRIRRKDSDGNHIGTHANLFVMSRSRFMRLWGYDEHFCGHYGHDDVWFSRFQKWHGSRQRHLPPRFHVFVRTKDTRSYTHSLDRSLSTNQALYDEKRRLVANHGPYQGHTRRFLDFRWEITLERVRNHPPKPAVNRAWRKFWWFRQLFSSC